MSMPREVLRIGCSAARSWSGRPRDAARSAARPGSGGEVRTSRTTRRAGGQQLDELGQPAGTQRGEVEDVRGGVRGILRQPLLDQRLPARAPAVHRPGRGQHDGQVVVAQRLDQLRPVLLDGAVQALAGQQQRAGPAAGRGGHDVREPRALVAAQRVPRAGPGQVRGPALGEGQEQRPEQVVMTGRPVPSPGVPHVRVLGVGSAPAGLHRRRPGLVQARVEDDLHPPDRRGPRSRPAQASSASTERRKIPSRSGR